ncbi:MAG: DUF2179 domain-containing protein [Syntrophomonadaceae bacterium]|nr:DUF2179 domain-containing protein [Syntrophomonadaceae bacterium]
MDFKPLRSWRKAVSARRADSLSITIYKAIYDNTNIERQVLNTIVDKREVVKLRQYIMQIDNKAFVVADTVADIYGRDLKI